MFTEIVLGVLAYAIYRRLFHDKLDSLGSDSSDTTVLLAVAKRLERLYGGKTFTGLRIPDADSGSFQSIDLVLVTEREAIVLSVNNLSGKFSICQDGSLICEERSKRKKDILPDPVEDVKKQASILESYLERRDLALPEGYLSCKVVFANPQFQLATSSHIPLEIVTYEEWKELKPSQNFVSKWIKGAFYKGKEMQESILQRLNLILGTSPMWDRLELKDKLVLGEFMEFKGKESDLITLRNIKRSKVSRIVIQKFSMLGFAPSKIQLEFYQREYRYDGASSSEANELTVSSNVEVVFHPQNDVKIRKFKLSSVVSLSFSA